jgi:hypothetical protein
MILTSAISLLHLPVDGQRVNGQRNASSMCHVAYPLYQHQNNYCLVIRESGIEGNIDEICLHWNIRRHRAMKWGDDVVLIRWNFVAKVGEYLEYSSYFGGE